jgi:hypothetical protein
MIAKVTQRTEIGTLRALPTARHARVERGNRFSPTQYAQLCMDCRRRSSSCCPPKRVPLFNESGKLVPTSHRWGHNHSPAPAGLLLSRSEQPSHGGWIHAIESRVNPERFHPSTEGCVARCDVVLSTMASCCARGEVLQSELVLRLQARSGGREQGVQQVKHRGRPA